MSRSFPRLKIIAIGFNMPPTGLTRVMNSIMRRMADHHEIHYLGIGYRGEVVRDRGLTFHPTNLRGGDVYAAFQAEELIKEIDPHIVFILHDIWTFEYYLRILGPYRDRLKIIAYIPLDGNIINENDAAPLIDSDRVVVYTGWAQKEFENAFERLRTKNGGGEYPQVGVIPHGIDSERFYPFPSLREASFSSAGRAAAKRKLFGETARLEESFVVLNPCRPDKRKRIDLTIEGFAKFAADKPENVRLCLHHAIMGQPEREQIDSLIRKFALEDRVAFNPLGDGAVNDEDLNLLYNACDVGLNTTMGEGWGLVNLEHAGAGAAQIVPDHSACSELWKDRGEVMPVEKRYIPSFTVLEFGEVSVDAVAQALSKLYEDPQYCQRLAQQCYQATQNPAYSWDTIMRNFDKLFVELGQR